MPAQHKTSFALTLALALTTLVSSAHSGPAHSGFLVRLSPGVDADEGRRTLRGHGLDSRDHGPDRSGWMTTKVVNGSNDSLAEQALLDRLRTDRRIASVEPNFTVRTSASVNPAARTWQPDDPWLARQWNLAGMPSAWYSTRGVPSVRVAVLDTGYSPGSDAPEHVQPGYDFVNDDPDPADDHGHGTHIASIIMQSTDNGILAAGIAPESSLLPIKVLDLHGHGTVRTVCDGIYFATDAGAHIINLSLALSPTVLWSEALHDAVTYAAQRGVVLVGASGNDGASVVSLPAGFNEVIAVGSVTSGGAVAGYSNRGAALDLVAPGGDAVDRDLDGYPDGVAAWAFDESGQRGLFLGAGTSQAAGHVSGTAALLMALGEHDRDRIRALLQLSTTTAAPASSGWNSLAGYGRLSPAAAIAARATPAAVQPHQLSGWVNGQNGSGGNGMEVVHAVGLIVNGSGGLALVLQDRSGLYGFGDAGDDRVTMYRLRSQAIASLVRSRNGVAALLEAPGSVRSWLDGHGHALGTFSISGGLMGMLGPSAARIGRGEVVALLDANEDVRRRIEDAGGLSGVLDGAGGFMSLIESAGGLIGIINGAGGMLALVDAAGGFLGLIESASAARVLNSANGLVRIGG